MESTAAAIVSDDTAAGDQQNNPTGATAAATAALLSKKKESKKKRKRSKEDTRAENNDTDTRDRKREKKERKRKDKKERKKDKKEKKKLKPNTLATTDSAAAAAAARKREKKEGKRERKADKKKMKKTRKRRSSEERHDKEEQTPSSSAEATSAATADVDDQQPITKRRRISGANNNNSDPFNPFPFDIRHVVAPMVGASELAFRLLARKYGATLAYTPMMSAAKFARSSAYRREEFQTIAEDRPLVCHFASNNPTEFAAAAKLVEDKCDAVDLNLGCPQRTAYVGHFGSYLLDGKDRQLLLDIVRAGSKAVKIPVFVKIRLLDTLDDTIELCRQLRQAGAALIAIHGRYRASFERKGPGARDGPAKLDQIAAVKQALGPNFPILSNGNVISYNDVVRNMEETGANGIMSAEGLLDNPALFLERFGTRDDDGENAVTVIQPSPLPGGGNGYDASLASNDVKKKKKRKLLKKLREIERIEAKIKADGESSIDKSQQEKLATKTVIEKELADIDTEEKHEDGEDTVSTNRPSPTTKSVPVPLKQLHDESVDRIKLACEYLGLARRYPVKIRSVIFHARRMCRDLLNEYQLMEECVACKSIDEVEAVLAKLGQYRSNPDSFFYDRDKAKREKEALEKKRREEGKRKAYEARMVRKAKREGLDDLEFYLRQGAELPTVKIVRWLRTLPREEQLKEWKGREHSQHCLSHHLDPKGCVRDRACAFLHVEAKGDNTFVEQDEVAG